MLQEELFEAPRSRGSKATWEPWEPAWLWLCQNTRGHSWGPDAPRRWSPPLTLWACTERTRLLGETGQEANPLGMKVPAHSLMGVSLSSSVPQTKSGLALPAWGLSGCVRGAGPNLEEINCGSSRECGRTIAEVRDFSG